MPHDRRAGRTDAPRVGDVLWLLVRHPVRMLVRRWNWKTALLSAALRGAIFFTANLPAGRAAAVHALGVDLVFRVPIGGFYGSVIQAFRPARPPWAAAMVVMVVVPGIAHGLEFVAHWLGSTERLREGVLASVAFSGLSALFNLFVVRRGVLIVGGEGQPFGRDLARLPRLLLEFLLVLPRLLVRGGRRLFARGGPTAR
jgi:hypothetical protein